MPTQTVVLGNWYHRTHAANRDFLRTHHFRVQRQTAIVMFNYRLAIPGAPFWRMNSALIQIPNDIVVPSDVIRYVKDQLSDLLMNNIEQLIRNNTSGSIVRDGDGNVYPANMAAYVTDQGTPEFQIRGINFLLNNQAIRARLGFGESETAAILNQIPMHGKPRTGFRYWIEGCDMKTLQHIIPESRIHATMADGECDRMCAYHMLEDRQVREQKGQSYVPGPFQREQVHAWMHARGHTGPLLTDGLTSDAIQDYAVAKRFSHCGLDLANSVLNFYVPRNKDTNTKTVCYVVVGDHCQPIIDEKIIRSIMQSATSRLTFTQGIQLIPQIHREEEALLNKGPDREPIGNHPRIVNRKRNRPLDRIIQVEFDRSEERQQLDTWSQNPGMDLEVDDLDAEDAVDVGEDAAPQLPYSTHSKHRWVIPLVTETDRFHFYTKSEDLHDIVEMKCKPGYQEGDKPKLLHYYICTDDDDVEFLYNYLTRVLGEDPLRYAKSYNGRCMSIRIENTIWAAHRDIHRIMRLHQLICPLEPFHLVGMGTYMMRILHGEVTKLHKHSHALWECLSHYSPSLQRIMGPDSPYRRYCALTRTLHPPFSDPRIDTKGVRVLIPSANRRRIDLIRSYASALWNLRDDQFPIHDPTNQVVTYNPDIHGPLPIGHYVIQVPSEQLLRQRIQKGTAQPSILNDWRLWQSYLPLGAQRVVTHHLCRALVERKMILKDEDIRFACPTDPHRQKQYGATLTCALQNVMEFLYRHPDLQQDDPKQIINHFIGFCNKATLMPHSGPRYLFHDLSHLYSLLITSVTEQQAQRFRIMHVVGHDPLWHRSYDHYQLNTGGITFRHHHLQPVWNVILECQAIRMFDLARPIPLTHIIQLHIDAIEYQVDDPHCMPMWAKKIQEDCMSPTQYQDMTPAQILENAMGRYKAEEPKSEDQAICYHYKWTADNLKNCMRANEYLPELAHGETWDTEPSQLPVTGWHGSMHIHEPEMGKTESQLKRLWTNWLEKENDYSGLLVTGAAGTGKTYALRQLTEYAANLGLRVGKTAYTHAACVQMGYDAITLCSIFGLNEKDNVRSKLATNAKTRSLLRSMPYDLLVVDELSMVPLDILEVLLVLHRYRPQMRLALFGDFHQLPPVEARWKTDGHGEDWSYFEQTDIFPYLVYDRVNDLHGHWLRLTECMRTSDPLLVRICTNHKSVMDIQPGEFPPPPLGIPVWRFICHANKTRKAINIYCMYRFLEMYPVRIRQRMILADLWAEHKQQEQRRRNLAVKDLETLRLEYERLTYRTAHWYQLQNFTYAAGMEVVCRCTIREWKKNNNKETEINPAAERIAQMSQCVNNRRAILYDMDTEARTVTLRWLDIQRQFEQLRTGSTTETLEDYDVVLSFYDFAFHFAPGFCITTHMAQGETIREHYTVADWQEIRTHARMAYVAVTRGSSSELLHMIPWYDTDPWNNTDTSNVENNILRQLYHTFLLERNRDQTYELDLAEVKELLLLTAPNPPACSECQATLKLCKYMWNDPFRFHFVPITGDNVGPKNVRAVCRVCYLAQRGGPRPTNFDFQRPGNEVVTTTNNTNNTNNTVDSNPPPDFFVDTKPSANMLNFPIKAPTTGYTTASASSGSALPDPYQPHSFPAHFDVDDADLC